MDAQKYQQLQQAFLDLREQTPADQNRLLADWKTKDAGAGQQLEQLLRADAAAGPVDKPLVQRRLEHEPTWVPEATTAAQPERIGPWKILQKIGEGGHGVVYMAEQTSPIRRRVAIKQIKPGMDSGTILARFEAERQALAMMSHPSIANVMDAGTAETGQPYFVMELVHGVPIDQFCDENSLNLTQRLQLLMQACRAIHHAHRKGIIHRDIKPANVLVTVDSGEPLVKIIDFGIAKALHMPLTDRTLFTEYGQIVGTLEYMSPEQALMSQTGIDVRSDVYALGVLLYLLVTGETPLSKQQLLQEGIWKLRETIRDIEPATPSLRMTSGSRAGRWKDHALPDWHSSVKGDLDWITMKALAKEPDQRYDSTADLAADVQHFLSGEPVTARPPGWLYLARKTVRRHWIAAVISTALLVSLLISTMALWVGYRRSQDNLGRAQQLSVILEDKAAELNQALSAATEQRSRANRNAAALAVVADRQTIESAWAAGLAGDLDSCTQRLSRIPPDRRGTLWQMTADTAHRMALPQIRSRDTGGIRTADRSLDGRQLMTLSSSGQLQSLAAPANSRATDPSLTQRWTTAQWQQDRSATTFGLGSGGRLLLGRSNEVTLLSLNTADQSMQSHTLALQTGGIRDIVWWESAQQWIVSTGANWLHLVDANATRSVESLQLSGRIAGVFLLEGRIWVAGLDGSVFVVRPEDGWHQESVKQMQPGAGQIIAVQQMGADLIVATARGTVLRYQPNSATKGFEQITQLPDSLRSARFTDDGFLVVSLTDGSIGQYSVNQDGFLSLLQFPEVVRDVIPLSQGHYAVVQADGDIFLYSHAQRRAAERTQQQLATAVDGVPISAGGVSVTATSSGQLLTSDLQTAAVIRQKRVHQAEIFEIAAHGNRVASTGGDQRLVISRLPELEQIHAAPIAWGVRGTAFSPDGSWLAAAAEQANPSQLREGTLDVWNMKTLEPHARLAGHTNWVIHQAFHRQGGQLVTLSVDNTARLWSIPSGDCLQIIDFSGFAPGSTVCPVDDWLLIGHTDGSVSAWHTDSGELIDSVTVAPDRIVHFVKAGELVFVISSGAAELIQLEMATSNRLSMTTRLPLLAGKPQAVRISPDQSLAVLTFGSGRALQLPLPAATGDERL
ncbi:MAG: serine/threonine-protein kinase [Planctomycetaceae bacterium]|nr:serine/threonine-protein kinase [Planctomycetaceae bacterium]